MLKNILELYYVGLENGKIKQSDSYNEILENMTNLNKEFTTNLNENLKKQFIEILNLSAGLEAEASDTAFLAGFMTGMCIAMEAVYGI